MASSDSAAITAVELTSSVQLLPPATNSGSASMPWMVPSYPMMVLQQGIPQSLFTPNVLALPDGHIMLAPVDESAAAGHLPPAEVGSVVVQLGKSSKPQGQWPAGAGVAAKGNSITGAPEAGNAKQNLGGAAGAMKPVKNGSFPVLASQSGPQPSATARTDLPAQPKRPLTPYMLFSKSIWSHVKAANSHLSSVCEIGAIVGSLWRDMDPKEKQRYNDLFAKDKERYENELQTYLKTTGLHASDLAKLPKPKRSRDKPPATSWPSFSPSSAPQGTQTMANGAVGPDLQASSDILPTFSQAWTGQVTPQQTAQQVLTQLGLGGQTLFANSDGSISIGGAGNVSNLLSLPTQSLQLVSVTGDPVMTIYSDTGQTGVPQIGVVNPSNETPAGLDGSRSSWVWQQQQQQQSVATGQDGMDGSGGGGMVLYQLPNSVDSLGKVIELKSQLGETNLADPSSMRPLIPSMDQQFSVEQLGQLVGGGAGTALTQQAKLEAELQQMSCALKEKAQEVLVLTDKLQQAYEVIDRYKQLSGESAMEDSKDDAADSMQDDGNGADETVDVPSQSSVSEN